MNNSLILGLVVGLPAGGFAAQAFSSIVTRLLQLPPKRRTKISRIPPWLTGLVERSFFVLIVAVQEEGIPEAMIGWLAIKLALNWQKDEGPDSRTRGLLALLSGAISLAFAFVGGSIIAGRIDISAY